MIFIASLVLVTAFALLCDKPLKKHPNIFYIGTVVAALFFGIFTFGSVHGFVKDYILAIFQKGALATAFFVLVMYAGALKNGSYLIKKLMPVRAQLSIMGAILILVHNITYGRIYFVRLFTNAGSLQTTWLLAAIISLILLVIMIPLTIMSFPAVRKKINPKRWKQIQRSAYVFYALIYVHVMLVNIPMAQNGRWQYIVNIIVYSLVFISYAVLRVRKAVLKRHKNAVKIINISFAGTATTLLAAVYCLAFIPMIQNSSTLQQQTVQLSVAESKNSETESSMSEKSQSDVSENIVSESSVEESKAVVSETTELEESKEVSEENSESSVASTVSEVSAQQSQTSSQIGIVQNSGTNKPEASSTESSHSETSKPETSQTETSKAEVSKVEASKPKESTVTYKYKNGTYSGKFYGYDGYVYATVTVENDKITSVSVSSDESDLWYFEQAQGAVVSEILNKQNTNVDAVSGATYSSYGIMGAVADALKKAEN